MDENIIENNQTITTGNKIKNFYNKNKVLIFLILFILLSTFLSFFYYQNLKENKKILLSDKYVEGKIYIENKENEKALKILKEIIYSNDSTYSTLALFLIANNNLMKDDNELNDLFNYLLSNVKFENEIEYLIIFKKAILQSNTINESELLELLKPVISSENLWKPHALLLLGDFFKSKKEYLKAKDFYTQILSIKSLNRSFYDYSKIQLEHLSNK
jgi:predicted negative regulator of RcsB-dependent stress response